MDSAESTTSTWGLPGRGDDIDMESTDVCIPESFRFSASYASRYNHCHGSANLTQSIPGFIYPEDNDNGRKGMGTNLHNFFANAISSELDLKLVATLLKALAAVWGPKRTKLIKDKKEYIIWWFSIKGEMAPVPHEWLDWFIQYVPKSETAEAHEHPTPPRYIVFLAEALLKVESIIESFPVREDVMMQVEEKRQATWLVTEPKTTVDLIIHDAHTMYVIDLKMGDIDVMAEGNEQLMYYAQTWRLPTFKRIVVMILQRNNINEWELTDHDLDQWIIGMVNSERRILDGDLSLKPGDHCKFCPANPHGRGDKGNKSCPAMLQLIYGERDLAVAEADVLEGEL